MPPWLLPASIATALLLGLLFPAIALPVATWHAGPVTPNDLLVALIFLLFGWNLSLASWLPGGTPLRRHFNRALLLNLGVAPLLAALCFLFLPIPAGWKAGLAVTACVPTTLSSAIVMVRQAGGNEQLSLLLTLWLSLLGVFLTPWTLSRLLQASTADLPAWVLLARLAATVALPLALGTLLRRCTRRTAPPWTTQVPSLCIVIIVWLTAARHHPSLHALHPGTLAGLAAAAAAFHLILLALAWFLFRSASLPDRIALSITGAQKTLPLSVALLATLPGAGLGPSMAFCVLHHFAQILLDSLAASRLRSAGGR